MSTEGIAYKNLLKKASADQLLGLCEPNLREILREDTAVRELEDHQRQRLMLDAVDIGFASQDSQAKEIVFEIIRSFDQDGYARRLANYAGIEANSDENVLEYYRSKPELLSKYLCWRKRENKGVDVAEPLSGIVSPKRKLRYYQLMGARKMTEQLEDKSRCLYQAPTGAGKTRTAMSVVARHFLRSGPTKVLWLASTSELVSQACKAFREEWEHVGDTDAVLYEWRGGEASFSPSHATRKNTMLVASVQLLTVRRKEVAELRGEVSLIVFDEAHQSYARTYKDILNTILKEEDCKLLGLSATPIRTEGPEISEQLAEMYGNNRIRIDSGNKNPIRFLIDQGFLAVPHFEKFDFHLDNFPKPKTASEDYDKQLLNWLGSHAERNNTIVRNVKKIIDQGRKRVLVFTPNILAARYCSLLLRNLHGVNTYCITGNMERSLRKQNLSKFSSSDPDPAVIFNCQVLTTGFDDPSIDAVVVARPTKSPTLYAQMIGRALRGPASSGTHNAYIYNFADQELDGYNNLVRLFKNFEQSWD